jgi:hypothetical protein
MNKPVNEITFHLIDEDLPEDIQPVLWWYKGAGCPPYCGSMADTDFPNIDFFFAWCEIPNPSLEFLNLYNKSEGDIRKENLKLHIQNNQLREQAARQAKQINTLLADLAETQDALVQCLSEPTKQKYKGGRENEEGEQTTSDTPAC